MFVRVLHPKAKADPVARAFLNNLISAGLIRKRSRRCIQPASQRQRNWPSSCAGSRAGW
jgi:hypothetical protein